ncbi:hypothetical protein MRB53_037877 [Persea americana]|nr:hypothetical protein MRB53_037877 [Persea americana]
MPAGLDIMLVHQDSPLHYRVLCDLTVTRTVPACLALASAMTSPVRVLLTGAAGFVGTAIAQALHEQHPEWTLILTDIRHPSNPPIQATFIPADITSLSACNSLIRSARPDIVIHTAGVVPPLAHRYCPGREVSAQVFRVNVDGTRNLLAAAKAPSHAEIRTKVKGFVYTSSCTVLTDATSPSIDYPNYSESHPLPARHHVYGASKAKAEALVLAANEGDGEFKTTALRPSVVFGPGDTALVPTLHACIAKGETPFVIGDGCNLYDFAYVGNVADAHVLAVENLLAHASANADVEAKAVAAAADGGASAANKHAAVANTEARETARPGRAAAAVAETGHAPIPPPPAVSPPKPRSATSAAGLAINITNTTPIPFRAFQLAVWAEFGHVPPYNITLPRSIAWLAGAAAEVVGWVSGADTTLCRGSVEDAVGVRYADCKRARDVLGFVPRVGMEEGVRRACLVCHCFLCERRGLEG